MRQGNGGVREKRTSRGTSYGIRFRAYGQRQWLHLGHSADGWDRRRAEEELANVLADVRRGIWEPPDRVAAPAPREVPTFHVFSSECLAARKLAGLRERSIEYLEWGLTLHLLPYFAAMSVDAIGVEEIDRYARAKVAERLAVEQRIEELQDRLTAAEAAGRPVEKITEELREVKRRPALSNRSINKTLEILASVLETAVEYGHIDRNPATGGRRRLPVGKPGRSWLDRAEHILALLAAARGLDVNARVRRGERRALLAVLVFAGLRIGELLALRWRDIDLARGVILVRDSKTAAGVREVNILPVLRDELATLKAGSQDPSADALVFGTTEGTPQSATNVRRRILAPAVKLANEALEEGEAERLPEKLTPHSLRRTYCSILIALGEDPGYVMDQLGHENPNFTMAVYRRSMLRRDGERERLKALVNGEDWGPTGTSGAQSDGKALAATGA